MGFKQDQHPYNQPAFNSYLPIPTYSLVAGAGNPCWHEESPLATHKPHWIQTNSSVDFNSAVLVLPVSHPLQIPELIIHSYHCILDLYTYILWCACSFQFKSSVKFSAEKWSPYLLCKYVLRHAHNCTNCFISTFPWRQTPTDHSYHLKCSTTEQDSVPVSYTASFKWGTKKQPWQIPPSLQDYITSQSLSVAMAALWWKRNKHGLIYGGYIYCNTFLGIKVALSYQCNHSTITLQVYIVRSRDTLSR